MTQLFVKRNFKAVSLLTIFTFAFYMVAAVVLVNGVSAATITSASDTMSRLQVSVVDVEHTIVFTPVTAINQDDGVQYTLASAFGDTDLDVADYSISQGTGGTACASWTEVTYVPANDVIQFECDTVGAAGTGPITLTITTDLDNPATAASYEIGITTYDLGADTNFGGVDDVVEDTGEVEVSILDDDTVNITGFIDTFITFDIDTSEVDEDCDAAGGTTPCDSHGGSSDNSGYVVDLGELNTSSVNDSGDSVVHADSLAGSINYIWFDTSTNADGGVVVTVLSLVGENDVDGTPDNTISALEGPGTNEIRSVAAGAATAIAAGDGLYGLAFAADDTGVNTVVSGSAATIAAFYDQSAAGEFGPIPSDPGGGTPATIFSSTGPLDQSRTQFEVAASPDATDGTGTYTDELTFIATATF
ncbi:MAG: hypothetical protein TR69_WS6001000150 [candidate division WS6 bacterium OLB20]|uniref:Uncharacterized protein n=1 Tax=candidate division WS6 bacterium OLB20 TaxID=1617426 RepID=A0A136M074_9BACT|nr:MAG: hypothetical protein TR69_WS6001000150 [candidate division WS6 bacterium OLB20]